MFVRSYFCLFSLLLPLFSINSKALQGSNLLKFSPEDLKLFETQSICFQKRSRSDAEKDLFRETCQALLGKDLNLCDNVCF